MKIRVKDYYRPDLYDTIEDILSLVCDVSHDIENKPAVKVCLLRCMDDLCSIWADERL